MPRPECRIPEHRIVNSIHYKVHFYPQNCCLLLLNALVQYSQASTYPLSLVKLCSYFLLLSPLQNLHIKKCSSTFKLIKRYDFTLFDWWDDSLWRQIWRYDAWIEFINSVISLWIIDSCLYSTHNNYPDVILTSKRVFVCLLILSSHNSRLTVSIAPPTINAVKFRLFLCIVITR